MNRRIFLPALCLFLSTGTIVHAVPNSNAAAKKAAAAAAAAAAARKAAEDAFVQKHLAALKPNLPNLTESELHGISKSDLQALYAKSYEASGMHMMEARQKAASVDLN